ncbi:hypothetical protein [Marinifilum fragile]|uniref:hypothetical protein n=1 Tax=Marinifilum fragile TaxID=570161 RepID=UPI0006CFA475|nr:hypothetical protein [Marinifilum fragile]
MDTKLLSSCTGGEAHDANSNTRSVLSKIDFSTDINLTAIVTKLESTEANLLNSIGIETKSEFTIETSKLDSSFDSRLICFKMFVDSNMHLDNSDKASKANKVWAKIEANNPFMYKLGYEEQMTNALSLFTELDQDEYQSIMADLFGVKESYELTKTAYTNLQNMYRKGQEVKALKKQIIPSSILKKDVVEVINEKLLPYLGILADNQPETYADTYAKITHYIDLINQKIRTRRSRATAEEEVSSEVE